VRLINIVLCEWTMKATTATLCKRCCKGSAALGISSRKGQTNV
jgi:hypothetical protein